MEPQEPTSIDYYLEGTDENKAEIRKVLDEQYDILKVPKEERIYAVDPKNAGEAWSRIDGAIDKRLWRLYDEKKDKKNKSYTLSDEACKALGWKKDKNGLYPSATPAAPGMALASCRVYLGVKILSDLETDGYCDLNAEL